HVRRLVPAGKRTAGRGGYLTCCLVWRLTVAGTVPDVRRLPPSPAALHRRTLVLGRVTAHPAAALSSADAWVRGAARFSGWSEPANLQGISHEDRDAP